MSRAFVDEVNALERLQRPSEWMADLDIDGEEFNDAMEFFAATVAEKTPGLTELELLTITACAAFQLGAEWARRHAPPAGRIEKGEDDE